MQVHHIQDGYLLVRGIDKTYMDTPANFRLDAVTAGITLPVGFPDSLFMYTQGVGMEITGEGGANGPPDGKVDSLQESIIEGLTDLLAAKNARETPPPPTLTQYKKLKRVETGNLGRVRVFQDYDEQAQRRLALMDSSNTDRIAARDLIIAVKIEVDRVRTLIESRTSKAQVDTAFNSLNLPA